MSGALALVGAGEYLPKIDRVDRWLLDRLPSPARVVCLPTAAGQEGEERIGYWMRLGVGHFTRLGAQVEALPVIDRDSAVNMDYAARIRAANFVYLSGGRPAYLHETLIGTPVLTAILSVLDNGGVVAGCSAGAMIWGEQFRSLRSMPLWQPGFNRAPGAIIIPHFDEMPEAMLHNAWQSRPPSLSVLGIDRDTALILVDGGTLVRGAGGVTVWNATRKMRYTDGEAVVWP